MVRLLRFGFFLVVLCSFLVACGGGGGGGGSAGVATGTGVFVDSPVEGMKYVSGTITGVTDQNGSFGYEVGLTVKFFVGDILVGETTPKAILTPKDLVMGANIDNPVVLDISRFLLSLDGDNRGGPQGLDRFATNLRCTVLGVMPPPAGRWEPENRHHCFDSMPRRVLGRQH